MLFNIFGKSGNQAEVSPQGSLQTSGWDAFMENALTKGDAYIFTSQDADVAAAATLLIVRNDSHTQKLVMVRIELTNGDGASRYEIHKVTAAYTASNATGTVINAGGTGKQPAATVSNNETANAQGTVFAEIGAGIAVETYHRDLALVLNEGEALGIDVVANLAAGACTMYGYFIDN